MYLLNTPTHRFVQAPIAARLRRAGRLCPLTRPLTRLRGAVIKPVSSSAPKPFDHLSAKVALQAPDAYDPRIKPSYILKYGNAMKTVLSLVPGLLFFLMGLAIMNIDLIIEAMNPGARRTGESPVDFTLMGAVFMGLGVGFLILFPMARRKAAEKKAGQNR